MSYKDETQEIAHEIAWEEHGKDFYDLTEEEQDKVYARAQEIYTDSFVR